MFILSLYDRNGIELNEGDLVKISDGKNFNFYCEITYLENEQAIAPFHTFSFHSFVKVDKVPNTAIKSTETRFNMWYEDNAEKDNAESFNKYLSSWKECESMLERRSYRITKQGKTQLELF